MPSSIRPALSLVLALYLCMTAPSKASLLSVGQLEVCENEGGADNVSCANKFVLALSVQNGQVCATSRWFCSTVWVMSQQVSLH